MGSFSFGERDVERTGLCRPDFVILEPGLG
jgi:hypothetical protein